MKWMFATLVVSVVSFGSLAGCGDNTSSSGAAGSGGAAGAGGQAATSTGTGGMAGAGGSGGAGGAGGAGGMAGAGGSGGAASTCDDKMNCADCKSCAQTIGGPCVDESTTFQMLPNWQVFYACVVPCAMKPTAEQPACVDVCCTPNQAECAAYKALVSCIICDTCPNSCAMESAIACPP